jgi:hypothetical protein
VISTGALARVDGTWPCPRRGRGSFAGARFRLLQGEVNLERRGEDIEEHRDRPAGGRDALRLHASNDFRLVSALQYRAGVLAIRFFGPHAEYDKSMRRPCDGRNSDLD